MQKYDHYLDFEEEFFVENNKPKTKKKKSYKELQSDKRSRKRTKKKYINHLIFSFLVVGCGDLYDYSLELELDPKT